MSVREATVAETDSLADVLAAAFDDDPVFGWMLPRAVGRRARLKRFFMLELAQIVFPQGAIWTTDGGDGAVLCLPPGNWRMPLAVTVLHGPSYALIFRLRLLHSLALLTKMERRHLRRPHYYIPYIGVRPGMQGRGLGTELMRPILERCDREGLLAYLEASNERNAALYARLGFEHLEYEVRVSGSPPLLPMLRSPA